MRLPERDRVGSCRVPTLSPALARVPAVCGLARSTRAQGRAGSVRPKWRIRDSRTPSRPQHFACLARSRHWDCGRAWPRATPNPLMRALEKPRGRCSDVVSVKIGMRLYHVTLSPVISREPVSRNGLSGRVGGFLQRHLLELQRPDGLALCGRYWDFADARIEKSPNYLWIEYERKMSNNAAEIQAFRGCLKTYGFLSTGDTTYPSAWDARVNLVNKLAFPSHTEITLLSWAVVQ
jgi:hypothetical protein